MDRERRSFSADASNRATCSSWSCRSMAVKRTWHSTSGRCGSSLARRCAFSRAAKQKESNCWSVHRSGGHGSSRSKTANEGEEMSRVSGETPELPDYAPLRQSARRPGVNKQGYYVGRIERNLYWVSDGTYQSAFLTTKDGVVLLDAPPTIGHNIQRAVDEIANANGVSNKVTYLVYSHHHADHGGASSVFDKNVARIGHEETRKLLLRDDDPARPAPEETFQDRRTLEIGGERIELAW